MCCGWIMATTYQNDTLHLGDASWWVTAPQRKKTLNIFKHGFQKSWGMVMGMSGFFWKPCRDDFRWLRQTSSCQIPEQAGHEQGAGACVLGNECWKLFFFKKTKQKNKQKNPKKQTRKKPWSPCLPWSRYLVLYPKWAGNQCKHISRQQVRGEILRWWKL